MAALLVLTWSMAQCITVHNVTVGATGIVQQVAQSLERYLKAAFFFLVFFGVVEGGVKKAHLLCPLALEYCGTFFLTTPMFTPH